MKKIVYFSFLISLFFISLLSVRANVKKPLSGKKIIIDAGHGGIDPGTVVDDIYEKDVNLQISIYLKDTLEKKGAKVLMTRDGDYDLASPNAFYRKKSDFDNRISLINNSNADMFLSIHLNYLSDFTYGGPQVFHLDNNILAQSIQNSLNNELKGNRNIKLIPSDTYMYKRIKITGVLIECGFLSNETDRSNLIDKKYQIKVANSISNGIINYFTKTS